MRLVNNIIYFITFCAFAWGFLIIITAIADTAQFLRTKKACDAIRLKDDYNNEKNNIIVNVKYFNEYLRVETEGKIEVDPSIFKTLDTDSIPILYYKKSNEIYLQSYREPNVGKLVIYLAASALMIMIMFLLAKRLLRIQFRKSFR
jgi:hypothetical protein